MGRVKERGRKRGIGKRGVTKAEMKGRRSSGRGSERKRGRSRRKDRCKKKS